MPDMLPDFKRRFLALLGPGAAARTPVRAEAPDPRITDTVAVLRLYDPIDSYGDDWGISAKELAGVLDELPDTVTEIRLLINSPGGEVTEAVAIVNLLRSHKARVVGVVEGIAASSASVVAASCDELIMQPNSDMMIHDSWGLCVGNADDMRSLADVLDHMSDNIASIYAAKAGGTTADWRDAMKTETWYSAEEAVAAGLADRVGDEPADDKAKNRHDTSIFNFSGRREAPGPQHPTGIPPGGPSNPQEEVTVVDLTPAQLVNLRQRLGLAAEADEAAVVAALDETPPPDPDPDDPDPEPTPTLPDGVVAVDSAQLEQLRSDAQAGREARSEQLRSQREQLVAAAVNDGRIPPARKDAWVAQLEADPGAETVLASLAKGTIPVNAIGNNGGADLDADEAIYAAIYGTEVKA